LSQAQAIAGMLLNFAERNPGMTRVIIGEALVNEDERLQVRMNQFIERVELALKQALRVAATQGQANEADVARRANMITSLCAGALASVCEDRVQAESVGWGAGADCRVVGLIF